MKIISEFRLKGLSKPSSATMYHEGSEEFFNAPVEMEPDRFNALFDYCKNNWDEIKWCVVHHDGLNAHGFPINPIVKSIFTR